MRIAIIGLGLIGGSMGLALKKSHWQEANIIGCVRHEETGKIALKMGAVDMVEANLQKAVEDSNIVIIATPILIIRDIFIQISPYISSECIVTDVASTKNLIMQWAQELLPPETNFIGGHPMAGKEMSGIEAASSDLFENCAYCLICGSHSTPEATQTLRDMAVNIGAIPLCIDAEEHDYLVAGISHLPLLLSIALMSVTSKNPEWERLSQLASSGYRDLTRLASGNPEVNTQIFLSNKSAIVSWIDDFSRELQRLRKLITTGYDEIRTELTSVNEERTKWQEKRR
jgi:prephenate dehydrogenase